jgi:hypothetical protein
MRAILIPAEAPPVMEVQLPDDSQYDELVKLVGGYIEALPVSDGSTAYANEEAKIINRPVCPACGLTLPALGLMVSDVSNVCRQCGLIPRGDVRWEEGLASNPVASDLIYGPEATRKERQEAALAEVRESGVFVVDATTGDPREPYIAGPVVVCGFDPAVGENRPIPGELAAVLLAVALTPQRARFSDGSGDGSGRFVL